MQDLARVSSKPSDPLAEQWHSFDANPYAQLLFGNDPFLASIGTGPLFPSNATPEQLFVSNVSEAALWSPQITDHNTAFSPPLFRRVDHMF